jgi:dienelactone hydrolase
MREYREGHEGNRSSDKTLWIVLGIVGGILVVGGLVCAGLVLLGVRTMQSAIAQAANIQAQLADLDSQNEDYAKARGQFKTKLVKQGPAPQESEPLQVPSGVEAIEYRSGDLNLKAWVNPPKKPGQAKLPAVLFLHGGWAFGEDDWKMAKPLRDAGYVVMAPMLRGENGQPGTFTMFYDEVDDVLAAADHLARLPYVDDKHIYIAGHSSGGTLTLLAAMASPRFRAAASFSGAPNQRSFAAEGEADVPYDQSDPREYEMRSAQAYATSFKCPVRIYCGNAEFFFQSANQTTATRAQAKGLDVQAVIVAGDHLTSVPPAMQQAIQFFKEKK